MSPRRDPFYLFASAAKCRRLARRTRDEAAARELLALAAELEMEAGLQAALHYPEAAQQERDAPLFTIADEQLALIRPNLNTGQGLRMALYRIYRVDARDRIADAENVECRDDEEARAKALQLKGDYPVAEVWDGARLVARV